MKMLLKITRLVIFFACFFYCGCLLAQDNEIPFSEIKTIPEGKGIIYIYRPYNLAGSANHYCILANGYRVSDTVLVNKTYLTYFADPGTYIFSWYTNKKLLLYTPDAGTANFPVVVEAGKSYFLRWSFGLKLIQYEQAKPEISECKKGSNTVKFFGEIGSLYNGFYESRPVVTPSLASRKTDVDGSIIKANEGYYKYRTKTFDVGNLAMYNAIRNKNYLLIQEMIAKGYDLTLPIFIQDFVDFTYLLPPLAAQCWANGVKLIFPDFFAVRDLSGYICTSIRPWPAIRTTPMECALQLNDTQIISILSTEIEKQRISRRIKKAQDSITSDSLNRLEKRIDSLRFIRIPAKKDSLEKAGYKVIVAGVGCGTFIIGKTKFSEVKTELGKNFEKIIHKATDEKQFSVELFYKESGLSFFFPEQGNSEILCAITFQSPFKGIMNKGVEINVSGSKDVSKLYYDPNYRVENQGFLDNWRYWDNHNGVSFYFENRKVVKIHVTKKFFPSRKN